MEISMLKAKTLTGVSMSRLPSTTSTAPTLLLGMRTQKNSLPSFLGSSPTRLEWNKLQLAHPLKVADINWHSLQGLHDGFLEALGDIFHVYLSFSAGKISFHGSFGTAHDYGDVADDMIGVFEWNVTSYATEWYVPVVDLVEIYKWANASLPPPVQALLWRGVEPTDRGDRERVRRHGI